ncbi:hypothetical protein [Exiguobacterium oxidotolerans]|nr:hypothetical protein [Exiguobacterium oxidotolerans]
MKKHLGWISVALIIVSFAQLFLLDVNGFWGTNILIIGLTSALVTALFSTRGVGKFIALFLLSGYLIFFVVGVFIMIG